MFERLYHVGISGAIAGILAAVIFTPIILIIRKNKKKSHMNTTNSVKENRPLADNEWKCTICGEINPESIISCRSCGYRIEGWICPICERRNDKDTNICKHCGFEDY